MLQLTLNSPCSVTHGCAISVQHALDDVAD